MSNFLLSESLSEAVKILKVGYLVKAIQEHKMDQAIIFCRTKLDCDNVERYLIDLGGGEWIPCIVFKLSCMRRVWPLCYLFLLLTSVCLACEQTLVLGYASRPLPPPPQFLHAQLPINPLTPKISLVILLTVCRTTLVMLIWRIWYWINL